MKLCRFELVDEPGHARSGMVFSGKVYETDGANAVAVHEADRVRPLLPVPQAASLRIVRSDLQPMPGPDADEPHFYYGNPASIVGPNQVFPYPNFAGQVAITPMVAAVMVGAGFRIDLEECDDVILGLAPLCMLTAPVEEEMEKRLGGGFGRSCDVGVALGPVITTPEELDDYLTEVQFGRRYKMSAVARRNGVEVSRGDVGALPWTFAEAIAAASESCVIREGDVFAMGPVVDIADPILVDPGDEFQLSIENLGTLSLKLSDEE